MSEIKSKTTPIKVIGNIAGCIGTTALSISEFDTPITGVYIGLAWAVVATLFCYNAFVIGLAKKEPNKWVVYVFITIFISLMVLPLFVNYPRYM
ncbi:MAG: hypothetical protein RBS43_10335 [Candidatus Cloacimonas sp.]|jgi:hypothetical protein|nr:hypothetical protein [Candidatus Cloacimonas sp.]